MSYLGIDEKHVNGHGRIVSLATRTEPLRNRPLLEKAHNEHLQAGVWPQKAAHAPLGPPVSARGRRTTVSAPCALHPTPGPSTRLKGFKPKSAVNQQAPGSVCGQFRTDMEVYMGIYVPGSTVWVKGGGRKIDFW